MVCALSPATNAWGEARAGGAWSPMLKYAGYDGVVFTGKAKKRVYCTGWKVTPDGLMKTAERIFNVKRLINVARGLSRKDDYLPKRLLTVPQRDDIGPVDPQGMERMLAEYYQIRGWDEKGIPTRERLKALRLA